MIYCQ